MHIPGGRRQARRGTGGRRCHVQPLDLTRSAARSVFPKHVPLGRGRVAPFSRFCRFPAAQCRSRLFLRRPSCLHAGAHASEHVQATSCLLSGHVSSRISRCGAPVGRGASVPRRCFLCIARCLRDFASCLLEGRAGDAGRQPAVVTGVCARRTLRRGIPLRRGSVCGRCALLRAERAEVGGLLALPWVCRPGWAAGAADPGGRAAVMARNDRSAAIAAGGRRPAFPVRMHPAAPSRCSQQTLRGLDRERRAAAVQSAAALPRWVPALACARAC